MCAAALRATSLVDMTIHMYDRHEVILLVPQNNSIEILFNLGKLKIIMSGDYRFS